MAFGIEIHGPYDDISGIATANREMALALYDIGVPVKLTGFPNWSILKYKYSQEQAIKIAQMEKNHIPDDNIYVNFLPFTKVKDYKAGVPNVVASLFETDRCPFVWHIIEKQLDLDEIWVPTQWGKDAFVKGSLPEEKIQVVPYGVDTEKFSPNIAPAKIVGAKKFIFLATMDYKNCKGPDILLNAYFSEFSSKDDVTLVFKSYTGVDVEQSKRVLKDLIRKYRAANNSDAHLLFIGDHVSEDEIVSLHRAADCYVLPTRGEGWSMGTIQSMACGVPTIMTDASAHRSYMNETNGLLIKCKQVPITDANWLIREPVMAHHEWWNPDLKDCRKQMRWAYEHPAEMKKLGEKARKDVLALDWHHVAQKIADRAIALLGK